MTAIPEPLALPLSQKIALAQAEIKKHYEQNDGKLFISFSGGKDSTILRDIALSMYPDLPCVFSNTTNELADVLKYVKTFDNIITVTPNMPFTKVVEKYGFPLVSKEVSQKVNELKRTHGKATRLKRFEGDVKGNGKLPDKWRYLAEQEFDVTHKCCAILKKNPLEKFAKDNGGLKPIIALMSGESNLRQQLALYGDDNGNKVYPFLRTGWTDDDIWAYAKMMGIRFAESYYDRLVNGEFVKARTRTGCEYCGFGITLEAEDRFEKSRIVSPKRFKKMMSIENNGVTLRDAIGIVKNLDKTPKLDLYGVKLSKTTHFSKEDVSHKMNHAVSTTLVKVCPHCSSKNIKGAFGHYGNFPDSPDPITKLPRRVFITSMNGYDCLDCKMPIIDDLHMLNTKLGVTNRLIKYIEENMNRKSFSEVMEETGIDFDLAFKLARYTQKSA